MEDDNINFENNKLIAWRKIPVSCEVNVTHHSDNEYFQLFLEISRDDCFFVPLASLDDEDEGEDNDETKKSQKAQRRFKNPGFGVPGLYEMNLCIDTSSNDSGFIKTTISAFTQDADKAKIKLTLRDDTPPDNDSV